MPLCRIRGYDSIMTPDRISILLHRLYPPPEAMAAREQIDWMVSTFQAQARPAGLTEKDAMLITYADTFRRPGQAPLQTLGHFIDRYTDRAFSGVHILPFYPSSSDDGFAVIDYRQVDPALGSWEDIRRLTRKYRLMFDAVINHVSASSEWFRKFKAGVEPYTGWFIVPGEDWDLSRVARPRTLPLLNPVETSRGIQKVWTTFSADQVDLNYANPAVLLEILSLILFYTAQGASLLRLDAIAYLWKQPGTTCLHLPQTHAVVQILRAVLDEAAPWVLLVSETNVPHAENISYFGEMDPATSLGREAQMVYQFPLAPLALDAFARGDGRILSAWVKSLGRQGLFFNFLASHDGIGVMPARGILPEAGIKALAEQCLAHGGRVSYRSNPDGSQSPYELNITLFDALNDPGEPSDLDIPRFLAAQAVMLSLAGVPGIYVHSLFGASNWHEGVRQTGRARSINRMPYTVDDLEARLADPSSREAQVMKSTLRMLEERASRAAFHPRGGQEVLDAGAGVFALRRISPGGGGEVQCMVNLTGRVQEVGILKREGGQWKDILGGKAAPGNGEVRLRPYEVLWIERETQVSG